MTEHNSNEKEEWFPMRVTYGRELKMKECLDHMKVKNFLPMQYHAKETPEGCQMALVPAVSNLIFVCSTQEQLTMLKTTRKELEPLRYMMRPVEGNSTAKEIIRVPNRQMQNFLRVATVDDDRVMFLKYKSYLKKAGQQVLITNGYFAGVKGVIKRIKNNRRVVVQIDGVAAVAIAHMPKEHLRPVAPESQP